MHIKININKIIALFLLFLLSINIFTTFAYANASSTITYNLSEELTDAEKAELDSYDTLTKMVEDIFSFSNERGDANINDTANLLFELIDKAIENFDVIAQSTLYRYIQGLAFLFLMIFFSIKIYDENSLGMEREFLTKEMAKTIMIFVFSILIIVEFKHFVIFLFAFFRFLISKIIVLKANSDIGDVQEIGVIVNPENIAYHILQESGLVGGASLIEEVSIRSKEASLRSMYMFPWMVNWVGKLGELIIAFVNSVLLLIYGTFFPISVADLVGDIKNSKFITYGKYLTSIAIEEVVIIATIYISEIILNPYIIQSLTNIANGTSNLSFVNMAIIITAVSFSKFIVLCLTFGLSRKLVGVI